MEESMQKQDIQAIVDQFVSDLTEAIRGDAQREVAERIQEFAVGFGGNPIKGQKAVKKASRAKTPPRPCPVPGCTEVAHNRYQLVCKKHREELDRKDILFHRDVAEKPGGIWYKMGLGPHAKADKKKAEKKAKAG
jgi:hypothetical protein